MFTGIIEDIGEVIKKEKNNIIISTILDDIKISDSISVNGVCLTVEDIKKTQKNIEFKVYVSLETFKRTNLKYLVEKTKVNIERALKLNSRLNGHFVSGHIDTTIKLLDIKGEIFTFELPQQHKKYIAEKGSVAIDGISLTVAEVHTDRFSVAVVPYTLKNTTLQFKNVGDIFNLEIDILARYVKTIFSDNGSEKEIDIEFLKKHGFVWNKKFLRLFHKL